MKLAVGDFIVFIYGLELNRFTPLQCCRQRLAGLEFVKMKGPGQQFRQRRQDRSLQGMCRRAPVYAGPEEEHAVTLQRTLRRSLRSGLSSSLARYASSSADRGLAGVVESEANWADGV